MFDITKLQCSKKTFRVGQEKTCQSIIEAFNRGKRFVVYQGPVGSGKSVISTSIAHTLANGKATHITPAKFLQTQFTNDFTHWESLQGRNTYQCHVNSSTCDDGDCKRRDQSSLPECRDTCEYFMQRAATFAAPFSIYNFDSYICQGFTEGRPEYAFKTLDEAHNIEGKIINYLSITITSKQISDLPNIRDNSINQAINEIEKRRFIQTFQFKAKQEKDNDLKEKYLSIARKLQTVLKEQKDDNWLFECKASNRWVTWEFKPIYCGKHCDSLLYGNSEHILLMSGTILDCDTFCNSIGIDPSLVQYIESPMTFPVSYRPIKFIKDAPYMNFRNKDKTYPYIVNHVERLLRKHNDTRGIIHTHTNEITSYIKENLKSSRLLFKEDFDGDATAVIEEHKKQSNSVLVSPSMHEGLDLTDDLGRFQIICKMPFPNRADKRIQKIIVGKFGENYYNWLANLKLYQSLGRINRHETDFGVSYVLDACAQKRLCSGPDYIKEALEDE